MTKNSIIISLSKELNLNYKETARIFNALTKVLINELKKGNKVKFKNLGMIEPKIIESRICWDPNSQETFTKGPCVKLKFKTSTNFYREDL